MARLIVKPGTEGTMGRLLGSMTTGMLVAIKEGNAELAATFAKLAAGAALTLMPAEA